MEFNLDKYTELEKHTVNTSIKNIIRVSNSNTISNLEFIAKNIRAENLDKLVKAIQKNPNIIETAIEFLGV